MNQVLKNYVAVRDEIYAIIEEIRKEFHQAVKEANANPKVEGYLAFCPNWCYGLVSSFSVVGNQVIVQFYDSAIGEDDEDYIHASLIEESTRKTEIQKYIEKCWETFSLAEKNKKSAEQDRKSAEFEEYQRLKKIFENNA